MQCVRCPGCMGCPGGSICCVLTSRPRRAVEMALSAVCHPLDIACITCLLLFTRLYILYNSIMASRGSSIEIIQSSSTHASGATMAIQSIFRCPVGLSSGSGSVLRQRRLHQAHFRTERDSRIHGRCLSCPARAPGEKGFPVVAHGAVAPASRTPRQQVYSPDSARCPLVDKSTHVTTHATRSTGWNGRALSGRAHNALVVEARDGHKGRVRRRVQRGGRESVRASETELVR